MIASLAYTGVSARKIPSMNWPAVAWSVFASNIAFPSNPYPPSSRRTIRAPSTMAHIFPKATSRGRSRSFRISSDVIICSAPGNGSAAAAFLFLAGVAAAGAVAGAGERFRPALQ